MGCFSRAPEPLARTLFRARSPWPSGPEIKATCCLVRVRGGHLHHVSGPLSLLQSSPPSIPPSPSGLGTHPPPPPICCTQKLILDSLFETRQRWHHPGDRSLPVQLRPLLCPALPPCWPNSAPSKLLPSLQLLWILSCEAGNLMCPPVSPGALLAPDQGRFLCCRRPALACSPVLTPPSSPSRPPEPSSGPSPRCPPGAAPNLHALESQPALCARLHGHRCT